MVIPRSGGKKNFLERVYRQPKFLMTCMLPALYVCLGGPASSSLAFASFVLRAAVIADPEGTWVTRGVAVGCITFVSLVHTLLPKWGTRAIKWIGMVKLIIMAFIVCSGFAALAGHRKVPDPHNFGHIFKVETGDRYGNKCVWVVSNAIIGTYFSYGGATSIITILGEVKNSKKTLTSVMPLALGTVSIIFLLVNIAYFAVIPREDIAKTDSVVAGRFFRSMFGEHGATRVLTALVALSNFWKSSWYIIYPRAYGL